jgi:hypothetical protein
LLSLAVCLVFLVRMVFFNDLLALGDICQIQRRSPPL